MLYTADKSQSRTEKNHTNIKGSEFFNYRKYLALRQLHKNPKILVFHLD